jgi:hypothetical protein
VCLAVLEPRITLSSGLEVGWVAAALLLSSVFVVVCLSLECQHEIKGLQVPRAKCLQDVPEPGSMQGTSSGSSSSNVSIGSAANGTAGDIVVDGGGSSSMGVFWQLCNRGSH